MVPQSRSRRFHAECVRKLESVPARAKEGYSEAWIVATARADVPWPRCLKAAPHAAASRPQFAAATAPHLASCINRAAASAPQDAPWSIPRKAGSRYHAGPYFCHILCRNRRAYAVKLEPQPQLLVECGLIKLKPCRISVSSKSSVMPLRYRKLFGSTKICTGSPSCS